MSRLRVAERVAHGGHNIPGSDIERRFPRSLRNLLLEFSARANRTRCFMNGNERPEPIFDEHNGSREVLHASHYQHLIREAGL